MSLKLKILVGIMAFSVVGAVTLLIIILIQGNNNTDISNNNDAASEINSVAVSNTLEGNQASNSSNSLDDTSEWIATPESVSDYDQVEFYFTTLNGYWTSGNLFFAFITKDGKHFIEYGLYGASYGEHGEIKDAKVTGTNAFNLTIFILAKPADATFDAIPERTETVYIDISNYKKENRLNVKLDNNYIGGKEWHTYEYGGTTLEEAFINGMVEEY